MWLITCFFWMRLLLPCVFSLAIASSPLRNKGRLYNLWNLNEVAECVLHYSAIAYNDYGCWCGVGGAHTPIDGIDECCMHHDKCYDAAVDSKTCFDVPIEYIDPYSFNCTDSHATCADTNPKNCGAALCKCDTEVVNCWAKYKKPESKAKCNYVDRILAKKGGEHFQI